MLILNCTKAAAEFFTKTVKGQKISPMEAPPEKSICADLVSAKAPNEWQLLVHAVKVKAKNVLVVMDMHTRFSITLTGVKKGDDAGFLTMLEHHLIVHVDELMTKVDATPSAIEASLHKYEQIHSSRAFYLRGDRSVQATINDVIWHFRQHAQDIGKVPTGVDLISQDVFANQLLRTHKDKKHYFNPHHAFLHYWLVHYAGYSKFEAMAAEAKLKLQENLAFATRHPELVPELSENRPASSTSKTPPTEFLYKNDASLESNVVSLDDYRRKTQKK